MLTYRKAYLQRLKENRPLVYAAYKRNKDMRQKYGITVEQFAEMHERQGGLCECCRNAPATDIDHDHDTGRVRALLCGPCNRGLGQFGDNPERLLLAAAYLHRTTAAEAV
jgi:hypothetical protein